MLGQIEYAPDQTATVGEEIFGVNRKKVGARPVDTSKETPESRRQHDEKLDEKKSKI